MTNVNILEWWVKNEDILPNWAAAYKNIVLCQPSSAAVENLFNILNISFDTYQNLTLEDYRTILCYNNYNKRDFNFVVS